MTLEAAAGSIPPAEARKPGFLARIGWVLFDWASQPFYTLVSTFLFAPYFANGFIEDSVRGQALWGYAASVAGFIVAAFSPILGAAADYQGGLKRWMLVFSLVFIASQAALWLAAPGASEAIVFIVLLAVVLASVAGEFAANFNNAVMPTLADSESVGRLSGIGWAMGYTGGLISLFLMAGLVVSNPDTGKSLLGFDPLIPFDPVTREADRLAGPFSALWFAVFILPYFLFTPDAPRKPGVTFRSAVAQGLASLRETFLNVKQYKDIALFMLARMVYIDGLSAIFIFGGMYGAAVFGWGAFQLGVFGIILSIAGAAGCFIGGFIDDRAGSKSVILWSLALLFIGALGVLSIDRDEILFALPVETSKGPAFASLGEQLYIAFAILIGLASGPLQASSRSLLARMAPRERMSEFFGLFAFSGKVTSFAAPLAVALLTQWSGSQRIGIGSLLAFLFAGFALMAAVKPQYRD